jgi:hypothetical protein
MKNTLSIMLLLLLLSLSGCEAIGDIFSAGFYSGLALVVLVLIVIVWAVSRRKGS